MFCSTPLCYCLRTYAFPLPLREIILRILLTSATANIFFGVAYHAMYSKLSYHPNMSPQEWIVYPITPLLITLHHFLRLWPRGHWLVLYELFCSAVEVTIVGAILVPSVTANPLYDKNSFPHDEFYTFLDILQRVAALAMSACSFFSFLILVNDLLHKRGQNALHIYDFSAGLCQQGHQWRFIHGRFTMARRYSTDNIFIQFVRAGVAILCCFAVLVLVLVVTVWQPLKWNERPGIKTFRVPAEDDNGPGFGIALLNTVDGLGSGPVQAILRTSDDTPISIQIPAIMNITMTSTLEFGPVDCKGGFWDDYETQAVLASCHFNLMALPDLEIFITIKFSEPVDYLRLYLGLTDSVEDILAGAEPIAIGPGANLRALSSVFVRKQFTNQKAAAVGLPQYRQFALLNARSLATDWSPSVPRDNNTATLRLIMQPQPEIEILQDYLEGSVLNGLGLVGGIWTLVNGVFATIFGSTLLLVLFGIKPLSIYGLIHFFRPGKGSLVDGGYVLSPEERDHIVGVLKEHLLDVADVGRNETMTSSPQYSLTDTVPQSSPSYRDVGV